MSHSGIRLGRDHLVIATCLFSLVAILALASPLASQAGTDTPQSNSILPLDAGNLNEVWVGEADAGKVIALTAGQVLAVRLEGKLSTGYRWEIASPRPDTLRQVGSLQVESPSRVDSDPTAALPAILGGAEWQILRMQPLVAGNQTVDLVYRRPWENAKPLQTITFIVNGLGDFSKVALALEPAKDDPAGPLPTDATSSALSALPASYNGCGAGGCPPVRDQGVCGSCWAFAVVGALETNIKATDGINRDLSEQYLVSCNQYGYSCNGGWFYAHYYHESTKPSGETAAGAVNETDFPYQATDTIACNAPHAHQERIADWKYVYSDSSVAAVNAIKQAIIDHGPVATAICAGGNFNAYHSGVFSTSDSCGTSLVNHAVVLVGWNDSDGAWILRNSWGPYWGENGYMRIKYGTSLVGFAANYIVYNGASGATATATSTRTVTPVPPTATSTHTATRVPPTATATRTATPTSASVAPAFEAWVNAGGPQYTDSSGHIWLADRAYAPANAYGYTLPANTATYATGSAIAATVDDALYQSERYWNASGGGYRFDLPNGAYQVDLKFAEIYQTATGTRIFDILINGTVVRSNFDIIAAAVPSAAATAVDLSYIVTVSNGRLDVTFTRKVDNPKLSAIHVKALGGAVTAFEARLNAGGAQYTDSSGQIWLADRAYAPANTYGYTLAANTFTYGVSSAIAATIDDPLYQSERYWNASGGGYRFDVPNGAYQVDLKFAEIYQTATGTRIFDILINGTVMRSNFDIIAAAVPSAATTAVDLSYIVTVSNGRLDVTFTRKVDNPKLSAIHVKSLGGAAATATATSAAVWTSTPTRTATPTSASVAPAFEAWLNAGGPQYTDSSGHIWLADRAYAPANAYGYTLPANTATYATGSAIAATIDDPLYQSERYWNASGGGYRFDVPNGAYQVDLKFAEIYQTATGTRIFDILINGTVMRSNFDIIAAAVPSAAATAVDLSYIVTVSNGRLDVTFTRKVDNPKLSAIHVKALGGAVTAFEARLNAGGAQYTDSNGQIWLADRAYAPANAYGYTLPANTATYATGSAIAATVDDTLYQSERWWNASGGGYRFDLPNGAYQVDLKFAEIYQTAAGTRIFDILINGTVMRSNFDIIAAAVPSAAATAVDLSYIVTVSNGRLDVTFTRKVDNPKLSAIHVKSLVGAAPAMSTPTTADASAGMPTRQATMPNTLTKTTTARATTMPLPTPTAQ